MLVVFQRAQGEVKTMCLRKLRLLLRRSIKRENAELTFLLEAIIGQRLIGVSQDKECQLRIGVHDKEQ